MVKQVWNSQLPRIFWWCSGDLVVKLRPNLVTPWTVAFQVPLTMEFPGQEYWSGLLFPFPGDLPDSIVSCIAGGFFIIEPPGKPLNICRYFKLWVLMNCVREQIASATI